MRLTTISRIHDSGFVDYYIPVSSIEEGIGISLCSSESYARMEYRIPLSTEWHTCNHHIDELSGLLKL